MHSHSVATGLAIARLLGQPPEGLAQEAAEFVEHARVNLALDNVSVTSAMMFAQSLIKMWRPHWKFAYTVGLSLGVKFTTEGFYISDIIDHVTDEFSLECLKEGECLAIELLDWANMNERTRSFRNALANVALENPLPAHRAPTSRPSFEVLPDEPNLHVLIVDDSPIIRTLHTHLVWEVSPLATVHAVADVGAATEYVRECDSVGERVHLILLDLNLSLPSTQDADGVMSLSLDEVLSHPNGFHVANQLDKDASPALLPPKDFRFKPFVAMVSYLASSVLSRAIDESEMKRDGSLRGCDLLLPKPMSVDSMRVLIEVCAV